MPSLLRIKRKQLVNHLRQTGYRKYILLSLFGATLLLVIGLFFVRLFGILYEQKDFPLYFRLFLGEKILLMVFMTLFLMLVLSALISALNIFFLSRDLKLLLSAPMSSGRIFLWKAVETALTSSIMVVFFALPVLFAFCYHFAPGWINVLGVLLVFLLYVLTGILLGILLGMTIPAFFSAHRIQPVLSFVSIGLVSFVVLFLRMLRPERFLNPDAIESLLDYMGGLDVGMFSYFPFHWAAKGLGALAKAKIGEYLKTVGLFLFVGSLLVFLIFWFQRRFYLLMVDRLGEGSGRRARSSWRARGSKGVSSAFWQKEVKTFLRSPSQWSQLLIVAALAVLFVLNIRSIPLPHPSIRHLIAFLNMGMAGFIVVGLASRFAFTAIPMEGGGLAHVLSSPVRREFFLRFKAWFYTLPHLLLGLFLFFSGDLALDMDPFIRFIGIVFLVPMLVFLSLLALYFGLQWSGRVPLTPQHLIVSKPGISYMLWSLLLVVAGMVYFVRPLFLYFFSLYRFEPLPMVEIYAWVAVYVCLMSLSCHRVWRRSRRVWLSREFK